MNRVVSTSAVALVALGLATVTLAQTLSSSAGYLSWTHEQAERIAKSARVTGRVGGSRGLLHTERARSYKLRATWFTPDVLRANARLLQLSEGLSDTDAEALVADADNLDGTAILVELDPDEGSGVIPLDWGAFLGAPGAGVGSSDVVKGVEGAALREIRAMSGLFKRDYDYDAFWLLFPFHTSDGMSVFPKGSARTELTVRIHDNEGRVQWPVPASLAGR